MNSNGFRPKLSWLLICILGILFSPLSVSAAGSRYVTANGQKLIAEDKEFIAYGATFYPLFTLDGKTTRGSSWSKPEFKSYIDQTITDAKKLGLNTLRVTDYLDGITDPYNSTVWGNMDYLLGQAEQNGIYVIFDLSTYRNFLKKQGIMPYSFGQWDIFLELTIPRYRYSKAILNFSIAGEVDAPNGSEPLRPTSEQILDFFQRVSEKIYELDEGHHLISPGGLSYLNWNSGIPWQEIFALPKISVTAIHVYSQGDEDVTIPAVSVFSKTLNKPFQVEEFGFKQSLGDGVRAQALTRVIEKSREADAGTIVFWNFGPEVIANSYDINEQTPKAYEAIRALSPIAGQCGSDLNGDEFIDISDYSILVENFLKLELTNARADINKDGIVDIDDYAILVGNFLMFC